MTTASTRPTTAKGFTEPRNLPKYLQEHGLFCVWRYEQRDDKWTKVPYQPRNYRYGADSTNPQNFTDMGTALAVSGAGFDGLGIGIFDDLAAIDIDHCIDEAGNLSMMAQSIIELMDSYTEYSPSGKGIRIIFRAPGLVYDRNAYYINKRDASDPREQWPQKQGLEVYIAGMTNKYVTVTGDTLRAVDVAERTQQALQVVKRYMAKPPKQETTKAPAQPVGASLDLSDRELLDRARNANNGDKFSALYDRGDWKGQGYPSQSEADIALCGILAYWTGRDADRIDRLFRESALMRDKWNRNDYRTGNNGVITLAISRCDTVYTPRKRETPPPPETPYYIEQAAQRDRAPLPWDGIISDRGDRDPDPQQSPELENTQNGQPARRGVMLPTVTTYQPKDYTDVGQATVFSAVYGHMIKYTPATLFLVYDGAVWNESEIKAQGLSQDLTERQLAEARKYVVAAQHELNEAVESDDKERIQAAKEKLSQAENFRAFVLKERKSDRIRACLTESRPKVEVDLKMLDHDGYLLNTPGGTVDLRTGEMLPHNPTDYCTKITTVTPNTENAEMFAEFIDRVTVGDTDLARYLQEVAGMCAIGHVLRENLIIAYGQGGNGKSTLFNLLHHVMGDYAGLLSAETLTANCRKNKSPEFAEMRGKRIIIAAELEEGMRLDGSTVKKLCSTDDIKAEKKYKAPFDFTPSHTVILYTNHLPRVGTIDKGTWDRLIVVPFNANFRGMKGEILNYTDHLFRQCGGAVLTWIIEGAKRFIANKYKIELPQCVIDALAEYRAANDWLQSFLNDCCDVGKAHKEKSGALYSRYREYCDETGEYTRSASDFKAAMIAAGFKYHGSNKGIIVYGLQMKEPELAEVEPYPKSPGYYPQHG